MHNYFFGEHIFAKFGNICDTPRDEIIHDNRRTSSPVCPNIRTEPTVRTLLYRSFIPPSSSETPYFHPLLPHTTLKSMKKLSSWHLAIPTLLAWRNWEIAVPISGQTLSAG